MEITLPGQTNMPIYYLNSRHEGAMREEQHIIFSNKVKRTSTIRKVISFPEANDFAANYNFAVKRDFTKMTRVHPV